MVLCAAFTSQFGGCFDATHFIPAVMTL